MIRNFDEWSASLAECASLSQLAGTTIGIEAAYYVDSIPKLRVAGVERKIKEELTVALGGYPLGYKAVIRETIAIWRKHHIKPYFVFSGLDVGRTNTSPTQEGRGGNLGDERFARYEAGARINADAWGYYDNAQVAQCLETFGRSTSISAEDLFRYLQDVLREEGVGFMVAPYGAWAQLAYLQMAGAVDAVAGASEIFLYDVPDLITKWDFVDNEFVWVRRRACIADLGEVPPDVFVDACLLAGSSIIPTLPQLETGKRGFKVRNAAEMIMNMGRSGHSVCLQYQDTPQFRTLNYLDRFRKAKMAIKHHVVLTRGGKVEPFDAIHASGDVHEFIGQRLPEELYFYLSKGIIGPRVLNWRTSGEILEAPPLDNGESEEYRKLVRDQLTELRTSTISLLSFSLHRVYQHRDLSLRCWFDKDKVETITMRNLENPRPLVRGWHVPESIFGPLLANYPRSSMLGFVVQALKDQDFPKKTVSEKRADSPLVTKNELLANSLWRLLHIRGYVDNNHNLTSWGVVLNAVMSAVPSPQYDEAALIAVELLRLGLLNENNMFPSYSSLSFATTDTARRNILLVSRVATLGRLQHKQIGFTGALSRQLLGWHSMISAVRSSLRDLAEVCLTTLLLNGDASRDRTDWTDLGLDLPFLLDHGCAMGLAMNIYLNKVEEHPDPKSNEAHAAAKENGQRSVFEHCVDFAGDVDRAMRLWDAVYQGVKAADPPLKDKKVFDEVDVWLRDLR